MARPLMATKLYLPRLRRGLVGRPRLLESLERSDEARLTLISAPAGFGKSTLLAAWLEPTASEARRPVAWLSLDPADNEPTAFWTYVVTALQTAVPSVGPRTLELLAHSPIPTELMITALLNELGAAERTVWLVLDDYHLVHDRQISQAMAYFCEHLPPQVHVVISTRADPDLPLARWRARGELVEIRAADLRFTSDETDAYLNTVPGLHLAAADVALLEERTEGWIAALQLAALSLQGRTDTSRFVAQFAGNDRFIVDYLIEEVLQQQPDPVRDFLMHTAVLDRLTGSLCDAVTGGDDGSQMLVTLDRANLFVVALDGQREWYRYHHLFADVLRARLSAQQPQVIPLLHQRASQWYECHDLTEEAISHALAASDFDRAAHLIELAVAGIRRHRQEATMNGWLRALPAEAVRRSPVLSVFYGSMLLVAGETDAVEPRLADAERALASVPDGAAPPWADTDDLQTLPATIAIYRASLAQARGDAAGTAQHARRALDLAGPDDHLVRGGAAGFLGLAAWADGDVRTALTTFTLAVASLHAAGNLVDELTGTVVLIDLLLANGRPGQASRLASDALHRGEALGEPVARATAELHVALAEIDVDAGDLAGARHHLATAEALGESAALTESRFRWFVAMSRVVEADGDPAGAVTLLDRAEQLHRPGFFPEVRPIAAIRARIWIAQGDLSSAADWAHERGISVTDEARYLNEFDHLTLVRLLLAQQQVHPDPDGCAAITGLLERLEVAAEAAGRAESLEDIRLLQGLARDTRRLPPTSSAEALSERERQVLRLLDSELSGPQIARELFISGNTLSSHTKHIFSKLGVTSRRAAVVRARDQGLM